MQNCHTQKLQNDFEEKFSLNLRPVCVCARAYAHVHTHTFKMGHLTCTHHKTCKIYVVQKIVLYIYV